MGVNEWEESALWICPNPTKGDDNLNGLITYVDAVNLCTILSSSESLVIWCIKSWLDDAPSILRVLRSTWVLFFEYFTHLKWPQA